MPRRTNSRPVQRKQKEAASRTSHTLEQKRVRSLSVSRESSSDATSVGRATERQVATQMDKKSGRGKPRSAVHAKKRRRVYVKESEEESEEETQESEEVDCSDSEVQYAAKSGSKKAQRKNKKALVEGPVEACGCGGSIKPSSRPNTAAVSLSAMEREELFYGHLKHLLRYVLLDMANPRCVQIDKEKEEDQMEDEEGDEKESVGDENAEDSSVKLFQFYGSLSCVWRFICTRWSFAEAMHVDRFKGFLQISMTCLKTAEGLAALLFLACPECRVIGLSGDSAGLLMRIVLEMGCLEGEEESLLTEDGKHCLLRAIAAIDAVRQESYTCSCPETHRQIALLLYHARAGEEHCMKMFTITVDAFTSVLFSAAVSSHLNNNQDGSTATSTSTAISCATPSTRRRAGKRTVQAATPESTVSVPEEPYWSAQMVEELHQCETEMRDDSCKFLITISMRKNLSCGPNSPHYHLGLLEVMEAFLILHRVIRESPLEPAFLLESRDARIAALHHESRVTGMIPFAKSSGLDKNWQRRMACATWCHNYALRAEVADNGSTDSLLSSLSKRSIAGIAAYVEKARNMFPCDLIRTRLQQHQLGSFAFMMQQELLGTLEYVELRFSSTPQCSRDAEHDAANCTSYSLFFSSFRAHLFFVPSNSSRACTARRKMHGGFLADVMGLGKTIVVLSLCAAMSKRISLGNNSNNSNNSSGVKKKKTNAAEEEEEEEEEEEVDGGSSVRRTVRFVCLSPAHQAVAMSLFNQKPLTLPRLTPLPKTTLLVLPHSLLPQWVLEIDQFYPTARYIIFHGPMRSRYTIEDFAEADFVLTTYETISTHLRAEKDLLFRIAALTLPRSDYCYVSMTEWDEFLRAMNSTAPDEAETQRNTLLFELLRKAYEEVVCETGIGEGCIIDFPSFLKTYSSLFTKLLNRNTIWFSDVCFGRIILDEAQKCGRSTQLHLLNSNRRWVVSGTPINNNNLATLAPLMRFLHFDRISSYEFGSLGGSQLDCMTMLSHIYSSVNSYRDAQQLSGRAKNRKRNATLPVRLRRRGKKKLLNPFNAYCFCRYCISCSECNSLLEDPVVLLRNAPRRKDPVMRQKQQLYQFAQLLERLMIRHEKTEEVMQEAQLTPVKETVIEVQLLPDERFLYDYAARILSEEVARLGRQGILGVCSIKIIGWVRLLLQASLHPATVFEALRNGGVSMRMRPTEDGAKAAQSVENTFITVSPKEALSWALGGAEEMRSQGGKKAAYGSKSSSSGRAAEAVSETTLQTLRKLAGDPPELSDCSVCLDMMLQPTLLSCLHLFCKECLLGIVQAAPTSDSGATMAKCPHCRSKTSMLDTKRTIILEDAEMSTFANLMQGSQKGKEEEEEEEEEGGGGGGGSNGEALSDAQLRKRLDSIADGSRVSCILQLLDSIWKDAPDDGVLIFSKIPEMLRLLARCMEGKGYRNVHLIESHITFAKRRKIFSQLQPGKHTISKAPKENLDVPYVSTPSLDSRRVLLLSSRAANAGLNLTFANHLVFMEPNLNPAQQQQAIGRVDRIGQMKETHVYHMYAPGTIEERIYHRTAGMLRRQLQHHDVADAQVSAEAGASVQQPPPPRNEWHLAPVELHTLLSL